jgi:hypothetical protein
MTMAQVITPPRDDPKERVTKDWYFAQRIRRAMDQVNALLSETDSDLARDLLRDAALALAMAHNALVQPEYKITKLRPSRKRT